MLMCRALAVSGSRDPAHRRGARPAGHWVHAQSDEAIVDIVGDTETDDIAAEAHNLAGLIETRHILFNLGTDILQPNFADMGGESCAQDGAQIVDRFRGLQLLQAEKRRARCLPLGGWQVPVFSLMRTDDDRPERCENCSMRSLGTPRISNSPDRGLVSIS